jgi:hypothetical protein
MFTTQTEMIARPDLIFGYAPILLVSALTGGAGDALDGIDMSAVASGYVFGVKVSNVDALGWWCLRAKALGEVEDGLAFVEPLNDAARILVRVQ